MPFSILESRLKFGVFIILLGSFFLFVNGCSPKEKTPMPDWPIINNPLAIRISNRIWLIDMDKDMVVGSPISLNNFKALRGSMAGDALALSEGKLYITNYSDSSETMVGNGIFVLDWKSWGIVHKYDLRAPHYIMSSPNSLIYVTGANSSIIVIDPSKEEEVGKMSCGKLGDSRSIYAVGDRVFVTYSHGICVIDANTNSVMNQSPYIEEPIYGSSVVSDSKIYLLHFDSLNIVDLSNWETQDRIVLGGGNLKAITLPENGKVYVAQCASKSELADLIVVNNVNNNVTNRVSLGSECNSISLGKNGKAYITFQSDNKVSIFDLSTEELTGEINLQDY